MQDFNYHCHTSFENIFDGRNTANEMLKAYEEKGFNFIISCIARNISTIRWNNT